MVTSTPQLASALRDRRVLLSDITWETYERLVDELERSGRRLVLTYDDGALEIEMPSEIHELIKVFIHDLLTHYFIHTGLHYLPVGQTTYRRRMMTKGIEADEAYYISSVGRVRPAGGNDPERDPPPDLAIEIEVAEPMLQKLDVYAAIGVPEVWHVDATGRTRILRLAATGRYDELAQSREVPWFTAAKLSDWVARRLKGDHYQTLQDFRRSLTAGS